MPRKYFVFGPIAGRVERSDDDCCGPRERPCGCRITLDDEYYPLCRAVLPQEPAVLVAKDLGPQLRRLLVIDDDSLVDGSVRDRLVSFGADSGFVHHQIPFIGSDFDGLERQFHPAVNDDPTPRPVGVGLADTEPLV